MGSHRMKEVSPEANRNGELLDSLPPLMLDPAKSTLARFMVRG